MPAADIAAHASSRVLSDAQRLDGGADHVVEVVDPALAVGEARVGGPPGLADQLGQRGELRLAADLDDEPAVGGPEAVHDQRRRRRRRAGPSDQKLVTMSVMATMASSIAMSTCWPSPVASRWRSAASTPITA